MAYKPESLRFGRPVRTSQKAQPIFPFYCDRAAGDRIEVHPPGKRHANSPHCIHAI